MTEVNLGNGYRYATDTGRVYLRHDDGAYTQIANTASTTSGRWNTGTSSNATRNTMDSFMEWLNTSSSSWGVDYDRMYTRNPQRTNYESSWAWKTSSEYIGNIIARNLKEAVQWFEKTYESRANTVYCSAELYDLLRDNENTYFVRSITKFETCGNIFGMDIAVDNSLKLSEVEICADKINFKPVFKRAMVKHLSQEKTVIKHRFDLMDLVLEEVINDPGDISTLFD